MGHIFSQLAQPDSALIGPQGQTAAVGAPSQVLAAANRNLPSADAMLGPDVLNPQNSADTARNLPTIGKPSFQQAATLGATPGGANAMSPALTKGGKLATILMSGLQGALAGRRASEEAVIQSGGHRSGGAGMGFEAGFTLPWQRAQQLAQTQVAQGGAQPIETPYGQMPAALAGKILTPTLGYEGKVRAAQIGGESRVQGAQLGKEGRVEAAEINRKYMAVPNVGLFDTTTKTVVPGTQQGIVVTPEIAQEYQLPQDFIGKPMSLQNLSSLETAQSRNLTVAQGAAGPAVVNKKAGTGTSLGLGAPSLGGSQEIADPNNPGETTFTTKGNAIRAGAAGPQSASVQVPRTAAKAEVPTKIGDQKVAFTTMIQHADLLRRAARALNNSDMQTLNGLENAFKNEFGYSGPITSAAIADAYKGEVSNVINKGHITDTGNEKIAHTLDPTKQNYQTIDSVLGAYQSLAQSKMNMLNKQKQSAIDQSQKKIKTPSGGNEIHYKIENGQLVRQ